MNKPCTSVVEKECAKKVIAQVIYNILYAAWKLAMKYIIKKTHGSQVVVWYKGRVLLVKSSYRNYFSLPGGYIKRKETSAEAAQRELKEESGISLPISKFLLHSELTSKSNNTICKDTLYEAYIEDNSDFTLNIDGMEIIEATFFNMKEIKKIKLDDNALKFFSNKLI